MDEMNRFTGTWESSEDGKMLKIVIETDHE